MNFQQDRYQVALSGTNVFSFAAAHAAIDGDDWGLLPVKDVQRRLVEADDFAIVQLIAEFETAAEILDWRILVNGQGLRLAELDKIYLTPAEKDVAPDLHAYGAPRALEAGSHRFQWSYAWNPPSGEEDDREGVTLLTPRLTGTFVVIEGVPSGLPAEADLATAAGFGLSESARLILSRTVEVASSALGLRVPDGIEVRVNGSDAPLADGVAALPAGSVALSLVCSAEGLARASEVHVA